MTRLTREQIKNRMDKVSDSTLPMATRKEAHREAMDSVMNPDDNFDPVTFDTKKGIPNYEVKKRERVATPDILPTMGMYPKKLIEGQRIGEFESKQDLYLMLAHINNKLFQELSTLKDRLDRNNIV